MQMGISRCEKGKWTEWNRSTKNLMPKLKQIGEFRLEHDTINLISSKLEITMSILHRQELYYKFL